VYKEQTQPGKGCVKTHFSYVLILNQFFFDTIYD